VDVKAKQSVMILVQSREKNEVRWQELNLNLI
jgi:hypothetical protein